MTGRTGVLQLTMGAEVACTDGNCGRLRLVVIDLDARTLTDLVVEPGHWRGGRLVPIELVDRVGDEIQLGCSRADFASLQQAEPVDDGVASQVPAGMHITVWEYPVGEREITMPGGDPVYATDGEIGRVRGFLVDAGTYEMTHVLLHEGHLWGQKEVSIPVGAIAALGGGIALKLTRAQVQGLPPDHAGPD